MVKRFRAGFDRIKNINSNKYFEIVCRIKSHWCVGQYLYLSSARPISNNNTYNLDLYFFFVQFCRTEIKFCTLHQTRENTKGWRNISSVGIAIIIIIKLKFNLFSTFFFGTKLVLLFESGRAGDADLLDVTFFGYRRRSCNREYII